MADEPITTETTGDGETPETPITAVENEGNPAFFAEEDAVLAQEPAGETPAADAPTPTTPPVGPPPAETPPAPPTEPKPDVVPPVVADAAAPKPESRAQQRIRELNEKAAAAEAKAAALQATLDERERQVRQAEQARQQPPTPDANQPWTPESGRWPTQAELHTLRNEDPLLFAEVNAAMANARAEELARRLDVSDEQRALDNEINEFKLGNSVRGVEPHPDYTDAVQYLEAKARDEAKTLGIPDLQTPHQPDPYGRCCATHHVYVRAGAIVETARRAGKSVPQALYELAPVYGWTPKAAAPVVAANGNGNGNGHTAPATAAAPAKSPQDLVRESQARSAASAGSIGTIPGGATGAKPMISRAEFAKLSEEEIDRQAREAGLDPEAFMDQCVE